MAGPTYRIPGTGLYLEADGQVVKQPLAGADVTDATEASAPALSAAYVGKGLQLLGSKADIVPGGSNLKQDLAHLSEGLESIAIVGEVAALAIKIAQFMDLLGHEKDAAILLLERIDARLSRIEDLVLGSWVSSRKDQIALLQSKSSTSMRVAQEYLALNRPQTTQWQTTIALADFHSEEAVKAYTASGLDGGFWMRPFSLKAIGVTPTLGHHTWLDFHPDRDAILQTNPYQQVWDYRFALPALITAVIARVAVIKAARPQSLQQGGAGCRELQGYGKFLRSVVGRIQDGLWNLDGLAPDQGSRVQFLWRGRAPVAAAQVHSGENYMRVVYAYEWEYLRPSDPELWPAGLVEPYLSFDKVNGNISAVGRHWWHLIWRDIGMIEMCKILSDLESVCTLPVLSRYIGEAQTTLVRATRSVAGRWSASIATSLSHLTSGGDGADDSTRTYRLYRALQRNNDAVRGVLKRTTDELIALAPPDEAPEHRGPVAWWRAEGDARDSAGGHDGRAVGDVRFIDGRRGKTFAFVAGGYVEVGSSPALESPALTVAGWVRRDGAPDEIAYLLSKGARGCAAASYGLCTADGGGLVFYVSNGEQMASSPEAGRDLWDNAWHLVAGVYDGEFVRLYVDGAEVGAPAASPVRRIEYRLADGDALLIGGYRGTCDRRFDGGQIDELRVFNRAFSADEIRALYEDEG